MTAAAEPRATFVLPAPPSREPEEVVVGYCLGGGRHAEEITAQLREADFASPQLQTIWGTVRGLGRDSSEIAVSMTLEADRRLAEAGGRGYIAQLAAEAADDTAVEVAVTLVRSLAAWRAYGQTITDAARRFRGPPDDLRQEIQATQDRLTRVLLGGGGEGVQSLDELLSDGRYARLALWVTNPQAASRGIPTGLPTLDQHLHGGGLQPKLYTLGGAPGMGKSSVIRHILRRQAEAGHGVLLLSIEQDRDEVIEELAYAAVGINPQMYLTEPLPPALAETFLACLDAFRKLPFYVDDQPAMTPSQIESKLIATRAAYPELKVVGIDYLHILQSDNPRSVPGSEQTISDITLKIRDTCKRMGLACILAAQLTKEVADRNKNPDLRPRMQHFRGSGAITYLSYGVLGLFRDDYYVHQGMLEPDPTLVRIVDGVEKIGDSHNLDILVLKQQRGTSGVTARLNFYPDIRAILDPMIAKDREMMHG